MTGLIPNSVTGTYNGGWNRVVNNWTPATPTPDEIISALSPTVWLDAQDSSTITQAATLVSNWASKVNGLNATQAIAINQPKYISSAINGLPAIQGYHTGVASILNIADSATLNWSQMTLFTVFQRVADAGGDEFIVNKYQAGQREFAKSVVGLTTDRFVSTISTTGNDSFATSPATVIAIGTPIIAYMRYSGTTLKALFIQNGTEITTSTTAASAFNGTSPYSLFARSGGTTFPFMGYIGENIMFNYAQTDEQVTETMNALISKWGA